MEQEKTELELEVQRTQMRLSEMTFASEEQGTHAEFLRATNATLSERVRRFEEESAGSRAHAARRKTSSHGRPLSMNVAASMMMEEQEDDAEALARAELEVLEVVSPGSLSPLKARHYAGTEEQEQAQHERLSQRLSRRTSSLLSSVSPLSSPEKKRTESHLHDTDGPSVMELTERLEETEMRLTEARDAMEKLVQEHIGELTTLKRRVQEKMAGVEASRAEMERHLAARMARVCELEGLLAEKEEAKQTTSSSTGSEGKRVAYLENMMEELAQKRLALRKEVEELRSRNREMSSTVRTRQQRIESLEEMVRRTNDQMSLERKQ